MLKMQDLYVKLAIVITIVKLSYQHRIINILKSINNKINHFMQQQTINTVFKIIIFKMKIIIFKAIILVILHHHKYRTQNILNLIHSSTTTMLD